MFSVSEKMMIAEKIEKILLDLKHPEMPIEKPKFVLCVDGKKIWSYAEITPNWIFEKTPPGINPWNEVAREHIDEKPDNLNDK